MYPAPGAHRSVYIIQYWHSHLLCSVKEGWRRRMRIFRPADVYGTTGATPFIRAAFPVLLALEDRKHVGEGPTLGSVLRPPVVVPLHAACPYHGVDAAAAAQYMTEGHVECAIVQSRRRRDGQVIVERPADVVKPDTRVRDGWGVVGSSRLDDEDLRAGHGQFRGENRTGRARSHHNEVIAILDFFIRCVDH